MQQRYAKKGQVHSTLHRYLGMVSLSLFIGSFLHASSGSSSIKDQSTFSKERPALVNVGAGVFNVVRGKKSFLYEVDYYAKFSIYQKKAFFMRPMIGFMGTSKASVFIYAGLAFDTFFGDHVVVTPAFAPGVYFKGKGKNLGYPLEFRSSIEIAYRFFNKSRLGMRFYHLSNASIGDKNPGTECLSLYYSIPISY